MPYPPSLKLRRAGPRLAVKKSASVVTVEVRAWREVASPSPGVWGKGYADEGKEPFPEGIVAAGPSSTCGAPLVGAVAESTPLTSFGCHRASAPAFQGGVNTTHFVRVREAIGRRTP